MAKTAEEELDIFIAKLVGRSRFYAFLKWSALTLSVSMRMAVLFLPVLASVLAALSTELTLNKFKIYLILLPIISVGAASFLALVRFDNLVPLLEEYRREFDSLADRYRQKRHTGVAIGAIHEQALAESKAIESAFFPKFRDQLVRLMSVQEDPGNSTSKKGPLRKQSP